MASRWREWLQVAAWVGTLLGALWTVLGLPKLWELYQHGEVSGVVAALAWVLPLVGVIAGAWRWRARWLRWLRARYVSALYHAAWPVRDDLGARFAEHHGSASDEDAGAESPWRARVRGLTKVAAEVLHRVLKWRVTYPGDGLHIPLKEVIAWTAQLSLYDMDVVEGAYRELEAANFVSSADWSEAGGVLHVVLDDGVKDMAAARELMSEIADWMVECGYWQ